MIEWNDKYSVGISKIDGEHKKLIGIINKAVTASRHKDNSKEIIGILKEMNDYAQTHFVTEENYMLEFGYPDYEQHKKEHQDFTIETIAFLDDVGKGESCLIAGFTDTGKPIHVVCGTRENWLVIITIYIPKPPKFKTPYERGEE